MTAAISIVAATVLAIAMLGCLGSWAFGVFHWFAAVAARFTGKPRGPHWRGFFIGLGAFLAFWVLAVLAGFAGTYLGGWNVHQPA